MPLNAGFSSGRFCPFAGCPTSRGFRDVGFLRHRKLILKSWDRNVGNVGTETWRGDRRQAGRTLVFSGQQGCPRLRKLVNVPSVPIFLGSSISSPNCPGSASCSVSAIAVGSSSLTFQAQSQYCIKTATANVTVKPPCPTSLTVDQITPKSLPDYDHPTWLTGVGILARMKAGPAGKDYTGAVLLEAVTPTTNSCPSNIQQYTKFPTITTANNSPLTVGSSAAWEGSNFPSILNDFYDSHKIIVGINVLGQTSVQSCVAKATQKYYCSGSLVGTFTLTNTYTRGTINGQAVTNVSTTKQ